MLAHCQALCDIHYQTQSAADMGEGELPLEANMLYVSKCRATKPNTVRKPCGPFALCCLCGYIWYTCSDIRYLALVLSLRAKKGKNTVQKARCRGSATRR